LRIVSFHTKFKSYAHLAQKGLEFLIQRPISGYSSEPEQEAEIHLIVIWIESTIMENTVIGIKKRAIWKALCLRKGLRVRNDVVEDFDICKTLSTERRDASITCHPLSSVRGDNSSVFSEGTGDEGIDNSSAHRASPEA
jgi:hypothetical protein